MTTQSDLTRAAVDTGLLGASGFVLLDIGANDTGEFWQRSFGAALRRFSLPAPAYVLPDRFSSARAQSTHATHAEPIAIDGFCRSQNLDGVDFINLATGGSALAVLQSARETLQTRNVLGLHVEMPFDGAADPGVSTFSAVDRLMRDAGYSLYDLALDRYSRAALPAKWVGDQAGRTTSGQVIRGTGLYLRDLAPPDYEARYPSFRLDARSLLKSVLLFELFRLHDCAAELLASRASALPPGIDAPAWFEAIVRAKGITDYRAYMAYFAQAMKERRFADFPDGRRVVGEGFLESDPDQPGRTIFRSR